MSRVNFSARNIISPELDLPMDSVSMPYRTFLELYKYPLINIISTVKHINYKNASKFWKKCTTHFNEEMYKYMNELRDKTVGGLGIILNRNPTINIGSELYLKIYNIKPNYEDLTLGLSNNILPALGADYDGDVLNIVVVYPKRLKEIFTKLSPWNLIVNRNDGTFNSDFGLEKDQKLGIFILNN